MAATSGKDFDPTRKYKVVLSEQLLSTSDAHQSVASVLLHPELKLPLTVRNARVLPGFNNDECELMLENAIDGKEKVYGGKTNATSNCALIFDPSSQTFILERIDTQFAFTPDNPSASSEEQSEDAMLNALIEQEGPADADNPFDWRHQLQRQRTPSPDLDTFRLDISAAPSPDIKPVKSRPRQASSPPGMAIDFEEVLSPAPDLEQEFELGGEEEGSDDGGLQISYEGASKPRGFRGRPEIRQTDGAPISLRSAANSQSPAIGRGRSPDSDADVDVMQLGSPSKIEQAATPNRDSGEAGLESAIDGAMDEEFDMEAEFERALEGHDDEEEVPAPAPAYIDDDSSSESEEE